MEEEQNDDPEIGPIPPIYEELIQKVYDGLSPFRDGVDNATTLDQADTFMEGVFKGYGKTFAKVAYNSPDYKMLAALETNVFQFSAAKNYHMLQDLTATLKDGDRVRSFTEFRREALKIVDTWNNNYGRTEYNTGVAAAQSIANWQRFEENKDIMPLLKFSGIHDAKECPICKAFDGLIRPVDDPVWNYANVPLHFNDRCNVIQLSSDRVEQTPDDKLPPRDLVPKMFRVNQAKEQLVFPHGSAYFQDIPKDAKNAYIKVQTASIRNWAKENLAGTSAVSPHLGKVNFGVNGIKETLNQPHDYYLEKNQAIYKAKQLVETGKYVRTDDDAKGRGWKWHYLQVDIADHPSYLVIRDIDGDKTLYSIVDKLKKVSR